MHKITSVETLDNAKPSISQLQPFNNKCYTNRYQERRKSASIIEARSVEACLVGAMDFSKMCDIYCPLKHEVDTVGRVKFEPSSYSSVGIHAAPLPSNLANTSLIVIQELPLKRPPM